MALFDVNPKLIGISVRGVKVLDTDELENFTKHMELRSLH